MSGPDPQSRNIIPTIERYAARLNPGLCAVALVLSILVAAETAKRLPALYDEAVAAQTVALTADLTAPIPPSE